MSEFSTIACYAALSICSDQDVIKAYSRMVAALVQHKRYQTFTIKDLCIDFEKYYGFKLLNQPMETIANQCIELKYFTYNASTHQLIPNYSMIDGEGFMDVVEEQNDRYKELRSGFYTYLQNKYNLHCSNEELDEKVVAFIERYGIKTTEDKSILKKVRDDFLFADYLVYCEENGQQEVLDYINDYTIGISLAEVFTYSERPQKYTAKDANVYLDTGILFRLFGIDSVDYSENYRQYISNMQKMGMKVKVYEHTVNEMIGIIERSKMWIGNPAYDATLCSESTYFFVSNNWTVARVDELSRSIRSRLEDEFKIEIDKMDYPKLEDIRTKYEADIKELIIRVYKESGSTKTLKEIEHSIDQDAKSIFFTQHKNGNIVPYHLDDIKNIFITLNRSLARVGHILSHELAVSKEYFIPVVMTDLKWGTLIWFNTPATLSTINRPRLVAAAYAAFRPSEELTQKLNEALLKLEKEGAISPEKCYFLKTNPFAQRLLTKMTGNDATKFIDETPLEILKEIENEAFAKGSRSRQEEVDRLKKAHLDSELQLAIEKQQSIISECKRKVERANAKVDSIHESERHVKDRIKQLAELSNDVTDYVNKMMKCTKIALTLFACLLVCISIKLHKMDAGILSLISMIVAIAMGVITLWKKEDIKILSLMPKYEKWLHNKRSKTLHFSEAELVALQKEEIELAGQYSKAETEAEELKSQLKREQQKIDKYSIDISVAEELPNEIEV